MRNYLEEISQEISLLIAEDDFASRAFMQTFFRNKANKLFIAEDGEQAIDIFLESKPDIVITDISMPKRSGLELAKVIKENAPNTYIILTTAFDNPKYFIEAIDIGVNQYVIKPITKESIFQAFTKAVEVVGSEKKVKVQQENIEKLFKALEHSQNGIIILNANREVEYVNQKMNDFANVYNIDNEFVNIDKIIPDEDALAFIFKQDLSNQENWNGVAHFANSTSNLWASIAITAQVDVHNELKNILIVLQDITEIQKAQDTLRKSHEDLEIRVRERTKELVELNLKLQSEIKEKVLAINEANQAKDLAQKANQAKSQFLANMSHELRTPLNGILGIATLLLDSKLDEKQIRFLKMVKSSGASLLRIINEILDISRIEAGKFNLELGAFYLKDSLTETFDFFVESAAEKGIELKLYLDSNLPDEVYGDEGKLKQALINLISNAIKFTDNGFVNIYVNLSEEFDEKYNINFKIVDSGIGIPNDKIDKLFKSFSQVDGSYTRKYGGVGLGLAITKNIINLMNGDISVVSEYGKGSEFHFNVILEKNSKGDKECKGSKSNNEQTNPKININTLIVEDSEINLEVLKEIISGQMWTYRIAVNGYEALELFKLEDFDLILMDVQMPDMDGLTATKKIREIEIREKKKKTPIIGITAHANKIHEEQCLNAGMDAFISKPFDFKELLELMSSVSLEKHDERKDHNVDLSNLLKSINFNKGVFDKIVTFYSKNYIIELSELELFIIEKNSDSASKLIHKMKSEIGNFGDNYANSLIKQFSFEVKTGDFENAKITFELLKEALSKLDSYLNSLEFSDHVKKLKGY